MNPVLFTDVTRIMQSVLADHCVTRILDDCIQHSLFLLWGSVVRQLTKRFQMRLTEHYITVYNCISKVTSGRAG